MPLEEKKVLKEEPRGEGPQLKKEDVELLLEAAKGGKSQDAVTKFLDAVMRFAYLQRASDVHLEPEEDKAFVRFRVDGILHDLFELTHDLHAQVVAVLKILTLVRIDEHRAPQDGRFTFDVPGKEEVDVRVSLIPTTMGEKGVLRLLSSQSHKLSLEQLGFSEADLARVKRAIRKPWGMILATGPTGSGKTTTIYAILEILNTREVNISTIEDPVEYEIAGVNQSQVDQAAKLTFANGLRSIVRQDPDIIMVGEIRDEETAKIAVNAALTGHKLLSTIHTNNAASTIPRLIDMRVEPFLISSTLICAIAQRLVRRVCPDCQGTKTVTETQAAELFDAPLLRALFGEEKSITVAEAKGCAACNETGYKGRLGIYEVLENSKAIQDMVVARADSDTIHAEAIKEGMTTIAEDGVRKIKEKLTTLEELVRLMEE